MNFSNSFRIPALIFLIVHLYAYDGAAQKKFEAGLEFDLLDIPLNNTYESGLGYYDINSTGKITNAAYLDFTYWPWANWGFSLGAGIRNLESEIQYSIPDPSNEDQGGPVFEEHYHYTAKGFGPVISVQFRKDRFRARLGYAISDLHDQMYDQNSSISAVTVWEDSEVIAEVQLEEENYFYYVPWSYGFLQFDLQYNIIDNVFLKVGFETTDGGRQYYPYTLKITGFTENTTHDVHVLNDFKKRDTYTFISAGIGYIIGFGKYNSKRNDE